VDAVTEPVEEWAVLVPELIVSDLERSIEFWCGLIGFRIAYARREQGFAYLDLGGAQVMLEQFGKADRHWLTGELDDPRGRGINFQISVSDLDDTIGRLEAAGWPLFMPPEEKWYRMDDIETGQRQFLVQDPDGYLLRLAMHVGDRMAA
jgi:catechol 2,3-dioxygenase-like lactoylglutathione lyase family enzyme